jgi:hypothetical protein
VARDARGVHLHVSGFDETGSGVAAEHPQAGHAGVGEFSCDRGIGVELRFAGIRIYEPRISQPRVYLTRTDLLSRSLRFHIEGRMVFENMEEEIKFDTVLEMISGEYAVK